MSHTMIETKALTRDFMVGKGIVQAVRGIDLHVDEGELVALLGPNGAGKSTTLRMLTTLIAPTSGAAEVAGYDVVTHQNEVRHRIGYIGQGNGAGHQQRGRDELVSQGRAYGMSRAAARSRADELIADLDLETVADRKVSTLSGGQRRRLDIAMGLVHAPELLFLDEPSTGLDPQNRANLQEQIRKLRGEYGTTVVLTTHYLDEADSLAERVIVVDHGRIIADDTASALKARHAGDRITLAFPAEHDADRAAAHAQRLPGSQVDIDGTTVVVQVRGGASLLPPMLRGLDADGITTTSAEVARPTLDDVFLNLTGRSLREGGAAAATNLPVSSEIKEYAA